MSILQALSQFSATEAVQLSVAKLIAYKHLHKLVNLRPKSPPQAKLSGGYISKIKGRGMEFDEARHYQPGDDIRAIDWRVTARTGKTHTKVYREERERPVFIMTDVGATMQFGSTIQLKSVLAGHLSALLAWSAKQRGDRVGGLVFNSQTHQEIKPANRDQSVLHLLQQMTALQTSQPLQVPPHKAPVVDALQRARRLAKPGSLVCIVSDFEQLNERGMQHLQHLKQHCEVRCYQITDPFTETLHNEKPVTLFVTDGVNEEERLFGQGLSFNERRNSTDVTNGDLNRENSERPSRAKNHLETIALRLNQLKNTGIYVTQLSTAFPLVEQISEIRR